MIFISYSRKDEEEVQSITNDIKTLGYKVWLDNQLSGGQQWWNQILDNIRISNIFIFVLSSNSINSNACKAEYQYAEKLGIPILPILIDCDIDLNKLPLALSKVQNIDYIGNANTQSVLRLARAIRELDQNTINLPDPLPTPPPVPISYMGTLLEKVDTESTLSFEEQSALVIEIKQYMNQNNSEKELSVLIEKFKNRRDLLVSIQREILQLSVEEKSPSTPKKVFKSPEKNFKKSIAFIIIKALLFAIVIGGIMISGFIFMLHLSTDYSDEKIFQYMTVVFPYWFVIAILGFIRIRLFLISIVISYGFAVISLLLFGNSTINFFQESLSFSGTTSLNYLFIVATTITSAMLLAIYYIVYKERGNLL